MGKGNVIVLKAILDISGLGVLMTITLTMVHVFLDETILCLLETFIVFAPSYIEPKFAPSFLKYTIFDSDKQILKVRTLIYITNSP